MSLKNLNEIVFAIESKIDDPYFHQKVFSFVSKKRKEKDKLNSDNFYRLACEEYEDLSFNLDKGSIQDSCSVRNNLRTRRIANLLIDEKGKLNQKGLEHLIRTLKKNLYFLGPGRIHDSLRQEHILHCLELLNKENDILKALYSISKPHQHPLAEEIIRDTLQIPPKTKINDAHARRAALSAWLCYLRQSLGSCFATAPAIIVHDEQPLKFFSDLKELFLTGSLKRTFEGIEYSVPLNFSSGAGDLRRPFVLSGILEEDAQELYLQPGFIASLESVDIIDSEGSFQEKSATLKEKLTKFFSHRNQNNSYVTNPEEIIRGLLLDHFSLTEEQLKEHENRPKNSLLMGLVQINQNNSTGTASTDRINQFSTAFKHSKRAFKALSDNALLRSWEYTIASFAETKGEFSRWNLYSSLGLKHTDQGGIGAILYSIIKTKLDQLNREIEDFQFQYEQVYSLLKIVENRLKNASSEDEVRWLKIDYRAKMGEFEAIRELRDGAHFKAKRMAGLFDQMIDFYIHLFPEFFQEAYDPEIIDISSGPYDDSPAGFRLLFKHGRSNSSQWSAINNSQEYIDALSFFFNAAERRMEMDEDFKGLEVIIGEITNEIINTIKTKSFLESALYRMAIAHNSSIVENPVDNIDKVAKKPWVYTSGGNLHTLVSVYFKLSHKPTSISRWVENPQELLVFLADTIKKLPDNIQNEFMSNKKKSMLMFSPTHAFLLKPGLYPFNETWKNKDYTYTWIRDRFISPMERFNEQILLNDDAMQYIIKRLARSIPKNFQAYFLHSFGNIKGSMSVPLFRDYLLYGLESNYNLKIRGKPILSASIIDAVLYTVLPIFPTYQLGEKALHILSQLPGIESQEKNEIINLIDEFTPKFLGENVIGAKQFQEIIKALICLVNDATSFPVDYHQLIKDLCEKEGFSMPRPIIFADTNWIENDFAFLINPGTGKFEFWRVDSLGIEGAPMDMWKEWLDGSKKHPDWGVLSQPKEYIA